MAAMRILLAAAATCLAAIALAWGPYVPPPSPAPAPAPAFGSHAELRQQVREMLLARPCRECHLGYLKTAKPGALRVFDLAKEDWPSTMADRQLHSMRGRLSSGMSPTAEKGSGEAKEFDAGAGDLDTVDRFIQAELAARAGRKK